MNKERYFLITDADSVDKLNNFLSTLEANRREYEIDYDTEYKNGILVIVDFE